ncbi:MAG TPA: hypothetical protein VKU82_16135 [Planctomycetaceae bacterium]|nr:hypothetical protein [Planctomycetaceae bacterium]
MTKHVVLRLAAVVVFLRGSTSPAMRRSSSPRPPIMPTAARIGRRSTISSATRKSVSP